MAQANYQHVPSTCRPGERIVFNALKQQLPDNYFVWYEPTLFSQRNSRRPDFVVLGPDLGLMAIEVKDWSISNIQSADRDNFYIRNGVQIEPRTNPEKQALSYVYALKDELRHYQKLDPDKYQTLLAKDGIHKDKLSFPISYLVAFPNITGQAWQQVMLQLCHVLNEDKVLLKNNLEHSLRERLLQARLFNPVLSKEQLEVLKWMLYPEVRIPYSQDRLLDTEQINLARVDTYLPAEGHLIARKPQAKLVRGVVGSGKSLILVHRAKFISEQNSNWRVLVLTYNKSLRDYLTQIFKDIGGDTERVEITNFHKWCYHLLVEQGLSRRPQNEASQKGLITNLLREMNQSILDPQFLIEEFRWIKERVSYKNWEDYLDPQKVKRTGRGRGLGRDEFQRRREIFDIFTRYQQRLEQNRLCDWSDIPIMMLKAMDEGLIAPAQYHAVLIDEAQDFSPTWFRVAFRMVKPETGMVFIVGDGTQKIYRQDFTWKELGLGITAQNSYVLRRSYRSTHEVIDVALDVIRGSETLLVEIESAGDSLVEPEQDYKAFRHGPLPVLLSFETPQREYAAIAQEILSLFQQGYLPKHIAILQRHRDPHEKLAQELRRQGIPCNTVKGDLNLAEPVVKICTCHSVKGLEFEVVFICGLEAFKADEAINTQSEEFQQLLDQERKLLYVGLTRARRLLYLTYSGAGQDWIVERLRQKLAFMQPSEQTEPLKI